MKTLDEVIKAYEQCAKSDWEEGCGDCAYRNEKCGSCKCVRNDDALHYLKEYRDMIEKLTKAIVDAYEYIKPLIEEKNEDAG